MTQSNILSAGKSRKIQKEELETHKVGTMLLK